MHSTVRDVMTHQVITVDRSTSYKAIVRVLLEHEISAVPVLGEADRVEGIVSEADLIEKESLQTDDQRESWKLLARRAHARDRAHAGSAGELMTSPAVTVTPGTALASAARLMRKHAVKRLPVVDSTGRLVGIVSRSDLLTPYLRPDIDIHNEILREVLTRAMSVDSLTIDVRVRDGVVTLTGQMETEDVARDTARLTRGLDGVVEVVDKLHPTPHATAAGPTRPPATPSIYRQ
jgi:CBS domain-containing protein